MLPNGRLDIHSIPAAEPLSLIIHHSLQVAKRLPVARRMERRAQYTNGGDVACNYSMVTRLKPGFEGDLKRDAR